MPGVTLGPPSDLSRTSVLLSLRVADIQQFNVERGQVSNPADGPGAEIRCYMRDPDGRLIEVR